MSLTRLKPYLILPILSGLLLWLALPGEGGVWPLLFIGLVPLLVAVQKASTKKEAALCGLFFGVTHFLCILYWIIVVLGRYGGLPLYISIPALIALALYMSIYPVVFSVAMQSTMRYVAASFWVLVAPALWVGNDWLRSVLFTGFPWMDLGYGLWEVPFLIQIADLTGHHGVTFCIVMINVFIFQLISKRKLQPLHLPAIIAGVIGLMIFGYSFLRINTLTASLEDKPIAQVGVVQGNILQNQKWSPEFKEKTVRKYIDLTTSISEFDSLELVVWPETAMPFYPHSSGHFAPVLRMLLDGNVALLTGAPWYEITDSEKKNINYFNSALLVDSEGQLIGKYYKSHLVPYGEYVPLKKYMPFLAPLVETVGDFTPGVVGAPLQVNKIKVGVLLCYESIFPDISRKWSENRVNVLVNLTNDAWYGKSSAPYQSFAMTTLRAIETRLSVIRSANTGISGVVDPVGQVQEKSEIFTPWAVGYPVVLNDDLTIFTKFGYFFGPACLVAGYLIVIVRWLRRK